MLFVKDCLPRHIDQPVMAPREVRMCCLDLKTLTIRALDGAAHGSALARPIESGSAMTAWERALPDRRGSVKAGALRHRRSRLAVLTGSGRALMASCERLRSTAEGAQPPIQSRPGEDRK
jgi:hypothetical protein